MMDRIQRIAHVWSLAALSAGLVCFALVGALLFGSTIETALAPVLTDVNYRLVSRTDERMTLDWWGRRGRPECELIRDGGLRVQVYRNGDWVPAVASRTGDHGDAPLQGETRPAGYQRFARINVTPSGIGLRMTLRHRCHPIWPSVTQIPDAPL